ncbi:Pre-mRNA-splicing factor [Drechslerella dactyloides]|uniref:Pre-mRNA-splicing factor 38 n=1 Tax=Drechslerella dactyloides TaxID=74499 RepID=A0AAD6NJH3_DREDA|nr:Pre-mRNA-splicing factor [Drechslerella dactyloides]
MSKTADLPDAKAMLDTRGLYDGPTIHSMNPLLLMEKIIRERIIDSLFWKEQAWGLNAATLLDRAVELSYIGGQYANQRPTAFICLVLKLLQLNPEREIILEYIQDEDFKYVYPLTALPYRYAFIQIYGGSEEVKDGGSSANGLHRYLRALAAFYIRLAWPAAEVYKTLEPLMRDYRKLRLRTQSGYRLTYVDEFIDELLTKERVCDIALPRMPTRTQLEDLDELEPREPLVSDVDSDEEGEGEGEEGEVEGAGSTDEQA